MHHLRIVFAMLFTGMLMSQTADKIELRLDHYLNSHPVKKNNFYKTGIVPDTLHVYAARVQFKEDNVNSTTGNGRLDLSNNYPDSVDAPPHDSAYFARHLEFMRNYYSKSSKGKLTIVYHLVGGVRNLPLEMTEYSPGRNENLAKTGKLFFDTWRSVDSVYDFSGIDPQKSAFIIFHAGVGRDVDLVSQGIFQGQLDIPSLYFGLNSLKAVYGDTVNGYHTNEGFIINNSAILPEQEWRIINTNFGDTYLELGVNGIIVATIGSHLGLPDLFNTESGITAIGRFGLMDGQSIFSYLGVFPPEPSAWEKQYLGWVDPIELYGNGTYTSVAASLDDGTKSVNKVFITSKEYFLLENRHRDAYNNGQTIYYIGSNGLLDSMKFTRDEEGFQYFDIWKLKGSIIDVDEFDWSLPGLKDDTASFMGGILIWHIDENVIDAKIASNTINNDIDHRGVDLEEAKGAQQIGVVFSTPFGDVIGEGTIVDYWFNGNHLVPATIYKNEFTPSTIPNSRSYSNLDSRVCLRDFSVMAPLMNFTFEVCSPISNIAGFPRLIGVDTSINAQPIGFDINGNGLDEIFLNVNSDLFGFRDNGSAYNSAQPNGFLLDNAASYIAGYYSQNGSYRLVSSYNNFVNFIMPDSIASMQSYDVNKIITSPVLVTQPEDTLYFGTSDGFIVNFRLNGNTPVVTYDSVSAASITELAYLKAFTKPGIKYIASGKLINDNSASDTVQVSYDNKLFVNGQDISLNKNYGVINSSPSLADLNKDGSIDIIFTADNKLYAVNRFGVVLDNFPFQVSGVNKFSGGVSIADLDGDGNYDLVAGTGDGRIYAYSVIGRVLPGFPLLTGREVKSVPAIVNHQGNFGIIAYSTDGYVYGWSTQWAYEQSRVVWKNFLRNELHHNFNSDRPSVVQTGDCLPKEKVYNWPNPVYGSSTNIRYFLNGEATAVKIKILDLSGELVTSLTGTSNNGFENEVTWDVSSVQSGIYIGVIELEGGSCTETVSFKIAIVK
jgi:hypothetical protein